MMRSFCVGDSLAKIDRVLGHQRQLLSSSMASTRYQA